MTPTDLVDLLAQHKTLGPAPREELAWLASHGSLRQLQPGDLLTKKGSRVEGMFIVLSGRVAIFVDRGAGQNKIMEWRTGDVTGLLPYSRLVTPPGDTVAQEPTVILAVDRDHLRSMIIECYEVTAILVHTMLDRARVFTSSDLHDEKMVSLGKLSAGLAHELNNPASAIERSAAALQDRLAESERASRALGASRLTDSQLAAVDDIREACTATKVRGVRSPIEEAERQEAIADWLADHGLDLDIAEGLADSAVTFEGLDLLAGAVDGEALNAVLRWAAAGCSVRGLASEIQDAAMRISGLVNAIKGFTHMDQAKVAEPVDLIESLSNTVAVLKSKARASGARHRPGPRHRPAPGPPQRRRNRRGVAAGPDGVPGGPAARRERPRRRNALNKPVLLIVDDDPQVLAAVRRDLRSRYREHYTVMSAASGQEALETARGLKTRGDSLAMVISDQRMPGMLGSEVLARTREVYPLARRVLLTAYSDIEAAVKAINEAHLDHYLSKPWEPPEEPARPARAGRAGRHQFPNRAAVGEGSMVVRLTHDYLALT